MVTLSWPRSQGLLMSAIGVLALWVTPALAQYPANWWTAGYDPTTWIANGATPARYAATWNVFNPYQTVEYFYVESADPSLDGRIMGPDPYLYQNGFVAWRESPSHEYGVVATYYIQWWYLCEDHLCRYGDAGYPYGVQDNGDVYGATSCCNSQAVVWEYDDASSTLVRTVLPEWDAVLSRSWAVCQLRDHDNQVRAFVRYDTDGDGYVTNFDIGDFVEAIVSGHLTRTGFRLGNNDIDPFLECLLGGCD